MSYFLAKTDPATYSIDHLEREQRTVWDGVRNPQALRAIRDMRREDRVFIYHSVSNAAVAGLAKVITDARPDPNNSKLAVVDLQFLSRFDPPTTLRDIKASQRFDDWALVRQSRLSTMAAPAKFVDRMRKRYPEHEI